MTKDNQSPMKTPHQIKLENMISSIPMFEESCNRTKMFHMRKTTSEKKIFAPLLKTSLDTRYHPSPSDTNNIPPLDGSSVHLFHQTAYRRPGTNYFSGQPRRPSQPRLVSQSLEANESQNLEDGSLNAPPPFPLAARVSAASPSLQASASKRPLNLNTSNAAHRAWFMTQLHASPKWKQIVNKNSRYPHIC